MVSHRRRAEARYGALYKFPDAPKDRCFYCGDCPETVDHCPPLAAVFARGADHYAARNVALLKVAACKECNSLLNSHEICCPLERRQFIHERLKKRYRRLLASARWTSDELEAFGKGRLRDYIQGYADFTNAVLRRIDYSAPSTGDRVK